MYIIVWGQHMTVHINYPCSWCHPSEYSGNCLYIRDQLDCFLSVEFIVPLENFSLIQRCHHCRRRPAKFDLCSAVMAIEEWGFFYVPQLLWHGPTLYNGHLQGPVTLTPVAERLEVELSLHVPVFTTLVCHDRGLNPDLPHARRTFYLYATAAVY